MELGLYEFDYNYTPGLLRVRDDSNPMKMLKFLLDEGSKICCMQDEFAGTNDETASRIVQMPLRHFLPDTSSFER